MKATMVTTVDSRKTIANMWGSVGTIQGSSCAGGCTSPTSFQGLSRDPNNQLRGATIDRTLDQAHPTKIQQV